MENVVYLYIEIDFAKGKIRTSIKNCNMHFQCFKIIYYSI